jgi:DNA-binding transcriptional ArsR family regulator
MNNGVCIRSKADFEQISNCKETIEELGLSFNLMSNALSLAGNEVRLKILFLLSKEKQLCVCDLSDILSMKTPAISQHLRKMKDGKIVQPERKAQTIFYSITKEYDKILSPFFELIEGNKILEAL